MDSRVQMASQEIVLEQHQTLVSKTDLTGKIIFVNKDFVEVSGFSEKELIGSQHNIVRHPDMPSAAFKDLWATVGQGKPWVGLVKNKSKHGDFYWVDARVIPVWNDGRIVAYMSVRKKPSREQISAAESLYRDMRDGKQVHISIKRRLQMAVDKMTLTTKLSSLMGVISLIFIVAVGFNYKLMMNEYQQWEKWSSAIELRESLLEKIKDEISHGVLVTSFNTYLETGSKSSLSETKKSLDGLKESLSQYEEIEALQKNEKKALAGFVTSLNSFEKNIGQTRSEFLANKQANMTLSIDNTLWNKQLLERCIKLRSELQGVKHSMAKNSILEMNDIYEHSIEVMVFCFVLFSMGVYVFINRFVLNDVAAMLQVFKNIMAGKFDNTLNLKKDDEIGKLMQMVHSVQTKLNFEIENARSIASAALVIKSGLDVCETNVMIADNNMTITYMNNAVQNMFKDAESDLKQEIPNFRSNDLLGKNVDVFHKNPSHQRNLVSKIDQAFKSRIKVGKRTFDLIATPVKDEKGQRLGTVVEWADRTEELKRTEAEKLISDTNARLKQTLDAVSANVMVADGDLNIIYMNKAVEKLMRSVESDLRKDLSAFDANHLIGKNIDIFHKNPSHQRRLLQTLSTTHKAQFVVGGRSMSFLANPVFNEKGERLGTSVEWLDRTAEVLIEEEVANLVKSASSGDLSKRISKTNKEGFFKILADGLNSLVETSERIISDTGRVLSAFSGGDLTKTIEGDYQGKFGELKQNANKTAENLTKIITQVRSAANAVASGADEIARGNADLSQRTEEQASSLEETASSMEEMTSVVRQSAENASNARQLSDDALLKARQGGQVVNHAVDSMSEILKSSRKIAEIIGVIDEIAFQTNLLALNAAVEAARAGEQGRGFAVVASEVRSLSQRSANAAKEIKELIKTSVSQVESGVDLVNKTGETLKGIIESVEKVTHTTSDISNAAAEQTDGIEQINKAVGQMDEMTQQNAALVEQASAASENMAEQARKMKELMSFFTMMGGADSYSEVSTNKSSHQQVLHSNLASGQGDEWQEF